MFKIYLEVQETIQNVKKRIKKAFQAKTKKKERYKRAHSALTLANFSERRSPCALFFEKMSGDLGALARKRAALTHALI